MIAIENQGQKIVATDFWDSDLARAGYCFLSWNAGAGRLLVPDSQIAFLRDMKSARYVIVSRGVWHAAGGGDALELLFEDNSSSPFCIHMAAGQTDRLLPDTDQGTAFTVTVWTRRGQQQRFPGRYRRVGTIPCLKPWAAAA